MCPSAAQSSRLATCGKVVDGLVVLLYPLIVFVGLSYLGVRWTALLLLLLTLRRLVVLVLKNRETSRLLLGQALAMTLVIGGAAISGSALALRCAPFLVSLTFLALFAGSLHDQPIIERFARLSKPELPAAEVVYCRRLTLIWVAVLAFNSSLILGATLFAGDALWAILVGPVSYGMLGLMFTVEYPYRKWRFQDFDRRNPVDRLLAVVLGRQPAS